MCDVPTLANKINQAFATVMDGYSPLTESVCVDTNGDQPITVTESSVRRKLRKISCARAGGPDDLPNWVLRKFADILAAPIADILNSSFSKCKVPRAWKIADVPPLPKAPVSVIRSVLEYACQVFHCNLPLYLSDEIERIQRRASRIIFPTCSYSEGLVKAAFHLYMTEEVNCARNYSATLRRVTTN